MPKRLKMHRPPRLQSEQDRRRALDERKGDDRQWYGSKQWRAVRLMTLRRQPLCPCGAAASEVHHLADRKDRPDLAYDLENLQALCKACHSRETMARLRGADGRAQPRGTTQAPP